MAYIQETVAQELKRCHHCGLESADSTFKYFDNKKTDQPRYKCHHCHKFFTLGSHGRPHGKTYIKKRNEDPDELKNLSRQCRHCGVADNAVFKYYNNKHISQPRFKCLSCGKQFHMRLLGTGEERHLVHTSSAVQTRAPRHPKQGVPKSFPNASNGRENGSYQPPYGSFMPVPVPSDQLPFLEPSATWFPETVSGEDVQTSSFRDATLAMVEENYEANFTSWTGNLEPSPLSDEDVEFGDLLEAELLGEENNEGLNDDALSSTANVADALSQAWSNEDAKLMNFTGAAVKYNEAPNTVMASDDTAEIVSESTSNNVEVMYGTLAVENPAASGSKPWTWTQNDTSVDPNKVNYAEDAAAFCRQIDFRMPIENHTEEQIDTWEDSMDDINSMDAIEFEAAYRQMDLDIEMRNYIPWNR